MADEETNPQEVLGGCLVLVIIVLCFYSCTGGGEDATEVERVVVHKGQRVAIVRKSFTYLTTRGASGGIIDALPRDEFTSSEWHVTPGDLLPDLVAKAQKLDEVKGREVEMVCFQYFSKVADGYGNESWSPKFWALLSVDTILKFTNTWTPTSLQWFNHIELHGKGEWKPEK